MFAMLSTFLLLLSVQILNLLPAAQATSWAAPAALSPQLNGVCPNWASINCQSISEANYCCTEGYYCAYGGPENHIGCCPNNEICDGSIPSATTTVYAITTQYTGVTNTEYVGTTNTEYLYTTSPTAICSTMIAHNGGNLPTTAAGECGPILIVSGAGKAEDWTFSAVVCFANMVGGMLLWLGMV